MILFDEMKVALSAQVCIVGLMGLWLSDFLRDGRRGWRSFNPSRVEDCLRSRSRVADFGFQNFVLKYLKCNF